MYIKRAIEGLVEQMSTEYAVVIVTGPRQVGKSTMLEHLIAEGRGLPEGASGHSVVTLDDLTERALAQEDPAMFLQLHEPPVLIDEIQQAPQLLSEIKIRTDSGVPAGSFWLTGSQPFRLMKLAGESLAGRAAILALTSLSQQESAGAADAAGPLSLDLNDLKTREAAANPTDTLGIYRRIFTGSMPAVISGEKSNLSVFYSSYLQTYIERDVRDLLGDVEALSFLRFMTAVAARCSQELNISSICRDVDKRPETVKAWLSTLERSGVIFYLHPYSNNQLTRTVKSPKLYFHDSGLVAYLTRWESPETLAVGAMAGALMENYVVSEVRKGYAAQGEEPLLYYYRDRDAREIDLVLESDGQLHPIEIKRTASPNLAMTNSFSALDRGSVPRGTGAIVCMAPRLQALDSQTLVIPAWMI